jgi:hypothetical protein
MAVWMPWDAWLASRGLRVADWPMAAEYVQLDTWAEVLDEIAYVDTHGQVYVLADPRLAEPSFAPLVAVLEAVDELRTQPRQGRGAVPGSRKALWTPPSSPGSCSRSCGPPRTLRPSARSCGSATPPCTTGCAPTV